MNRPDNMKSKGKAMRNGAKAKPTKDDIYEEEYLKPERFLLSLCG